MPRLALGYMAIAAVLGALVLQYPNVHGFVVAFAVVSALGTVLGLASPGMRTVAKVLVVGVLTLPLLGGLTACALFSKAVVVVPMEVKACGLQAVDAFLEVTSAVESGNYLGLLDAVLLKFGPVAKCAVDTYIAWSSPKASTAQGLLSEAPPSPVADPVTPLDRARAWRALHQF
jgi:hypothetical protein